ncbi:ferredoxin-fold anticodon-binding domain-containing protein 1 homolog [Amphiura filiformis]|uniref:ferredoxin-fold anticodon-binding domain-containing protein 1 homolog n=1 Tax=Amphiura filiformis TaxID=82378 RepID=UPI003B2267FB
MLYLDHVYLSTIKLIMNELLGDCNAILLVGEASFSFSASLTKYLGKNVKITASSFETEEAVKGRLKGGDNVKLLKKYGAEVLYGIDATKLHEMAALQGKKFDAIIFNFPHIGRKASIKMNRQLLKDFFISCSHLLSGNGRVLVSLCNGQGGTPVDSPQREWNNSWQIVAMATYGSFILTEAMPFTSAFPGEYSNTRYRGQNKGFHADGAVTHIFEKGLPLTLLYTKLNQVTVTATAQGNGTCSVQLPDELNHFKNRHLLNETGHPLHQFTSQLISQLRAQVPDLQELPSSSLPLVLQQTHPGCTEEYAIEIKDKIDFGEQNSSVERDEAITDGGPEERHCDKSSKTNQRKIPDEIDDGERNDSLMGRRNCDKSSKANQSDNLDEDENSEQNDSAQRDDTSAGNGERNSDKSRKLNHGTSKCKTDATCGIVAFNLISSSLQHIPAILNEHSLHPLMLTSAVYHRCAFSRHILPIMHQMLVALPQQNALWDVCEERVLGVLKHVLGDEADIVTRPLASFADTERGSDADDEHNILQHLVCCLPKSIEVTDLCSLSLLKEETTIPFGVCGKVTVNSKLAKFILLSLDRLVMHKHSITDIRLLWTDDPNQWRHSQLKENEYQSESHGLKQVIIKPVSKFPTSYIHDLSFWVTKETQFNKVKFFSVIRKITGLLVEEVKLLDSYTDDSTGWVSLCYRLVYRSIDRALSKDAAAQIQLVVRDAVRKEMGVKLR